jgi:hypothetical protein
MSALSRPEFHDEAKAFEHLEKVVWNRQPVCPHTHSTRAVSAAKMAAKVFR